MRDVQHHRMAKPLLVQIQDAWRVASDDGMSMVALLGRSGLALDISVLSRKLSGTVAMRIEECEALAVALGIEVKAGKRRAS